jgi:transposase
MEKRRRFTAEFKRESVRLFRAAKKPAAELARELGIPRNRLYKWVEDAGKKGDKAFQGSGRPTVEAGSLAALQRENARLKEENEISKKAGAYFARELP